MNKHYDRLDRRVQKWIHRQGWRELREIQDRAIPPILDADKDVIIAASTAAGKTEAFFLPAMSAIVDQEEGVGILYISPLKALINDQYRRLEELGEDTGIPVFPWHGDVSASIKKKAKADPKGVLLITPESLESLLINQMPWVKDAFRNLRYIVIDELHAFIGSVRGQHLLSLMSRLEHVLERLENPIPRIGLSATLGEIEAVPRYLRPNQRFPSLILEQSHDSHRIKVMVRSFVDDPQDGLTKDQTAVSSIYKIAEHAYQHCRGSNHLMFTNSRSATELLASYLSDLSEADRVPLEFFPHHGSLSKELREDLEKRLQTSQYPTTAICTVTLELGIDIGKVDSVYQVDPPNSISSLRQRLGRSGRRGQPSVLKMLIPCDHLTIESHPIDYLRLSLIQALAMIRLLILEKFYEPADTANLHLSTLLHQILALTGQWGGIRADQLFTILCREGPFQSVQPGVFKELLRAMAEQELITQLESGEIVLGLKGEQHVGHYKFYAVFKTPEEFRIVSGNRTIGTLPVDNMVMKDQYLIFAGQRWQVTDVDESQKVITVKPAKGGVIPRFKNGGSFTIHKRLRQEMLSILKDRDYRIAVGDRKVDFADAISRELFEAAVEQFYKYELDKRPMLTIDNTVYIFPWLGDKGSNTLSVLLIAGGYQTSVFDGFIEVYGSNEEEIKRYLIQARKDNAFTPESLAQYVVLKDIEKYDHLLSDELQCQSYGSMAFDLNEAFEWVDSLDNID